MSDSKHFDVSFVDLKNEESISKLELHSSKYKIEDVVKAARCLDLQPHEFIKFVEGMGMDINAYLSNWKSLKSPSSLNYSN